MKITWEAKCHLLCLQTYPWGEPKPGDFYVIKRPDLEVFEITDVQPSSHGDFAVQAKCHMHDG